MNEVLYTVFMLLTAMAIMFAVCLMACLTISLINYIKKRIKRLFGHKDNNNKFLGEEEQI